MIKKLVNVFNSWEEIVEKINEIIEKGGGGGGFEPTEGQLEAMDSGATREKIQSIANKLDKVETAGKAVYYKDGTTQGTMPVKNSIDSTALATELMDAKTIFDNCYNIVKHEVDIANNWTFNGKTKIPIYKIGKLCFMQCDFIYNGTVSGQQRVINSLPEELAPPVGTKAFGLLWKWNTSTATEDDKTTIGMIQNDGLGWRYYIRNVDPAESYQGFMFWHCA